MGTIWGKLFPKEELRIIFQGLDGAGKTMALYQLKIGEGVTTSSTIGFNVETVEHKNINITIWDLGGGDKLAPTRIYDVLRIIWYNIMRHLCRHHYPNTNALVYVVDSSDRDRIKEARDELQRAMADDELRGITLLILANKQDIANVMSVDQITEELQLHKLGARNWNIIPTVATKGDGLYDALDWLTYACKGTKRQRFQ